MSVKNLGDKIKNFQLNRSWQWLLYIYIVLPLILYLVAFLTKSPAISSVFHTYGLFIMSCIPNFKSGTGVFGLLIALYFLGKALYKKKYVDFAISAVLVIANFAYFFFNINYILARFLTF